VPARGPAIRLLPRLEPDNTFFWTSGADGHLRFLRCLHCSYFVHPPAPRCPECLSEGVAPHVVSGRATVVAHTVNIHQWIPGSEPYVIGLVAIEEQESVRLTTNLVDVEPADIRPGMPVEVVFEQHDDVFLPLFRPAPAVGSGH
jgi:uncharacterized OB-fold protein